MKWGDYMTGNEILKLKLLELGATKQQAEAKVVDMVIAVLAENSDVKDLNALEMFRNVIDKFDTAAQNARAKEHEYLNKTVKLSLVKSAVCNAKRDVECAVKELANIVDELISISDEITEPETPEQRDRMRMARFLMENTKVNTCYDNTAFIKALGNILSGAKEADEPKQVRAEKVRTARDKESESSIKERLKEIKAILAKKVYFNYPLEDFGISEVEWAPMQSECKRL